MNQASKRHVREMGIAVLKREAQSVTDLIERVNESFEAACELMLGCQGRIVVTGMGKSGHIGSKIAATLASTGTPAFFMHPGEASHGDLGMITAGDVVMALSNSGTTEEIVSIVPLIKRLGVPMIALTGKPDSTLAQEANVHIDVSVQEEACPLGLAPTSSTTAALAMGDALAIALLDNRGFTEQDFARSHPGGQLGRRLLLHISDIMQTGEDIPHVAPEASLDDAMKEMSRCGIGMTAITDNQMKVLGIYTDGDIRRTLEKRLDPKKTPVSEIMTTNCTTVSADTLAAEGLQIMQEKSINALLVVDTNNHLVGALNMHTLLRCGVA